MFIAVDLTVTFKSCVYLYKFTLDVDIFYTIVCFTFISGNYANMGFL
jgi:hypothetical protein